MSIPGYLPRLVIALGSAAAALVALGLVLYAGLEPFGALAAAGLGGLSLLVLRRSARTRQPSVPAEAGAASPGRATEEPPASLATRNEVSGPPRRAMAGVPKAGEADVTMDLTGAIVGWGPHAEHLFGWSRDEVLGRRLIIFPPDAHPASQDGPGHALASETAWSLIGKVELRAEHRQGHLVPVEMTVWRTDGGGGHAGVLKAWIRAVPEAMTAHEGCRVGSLVESSGDAMIGVDLDGTILTWNPGAEELYGYTAPEAIGRPIWQLSPEERRAEVADVLSEIGLGRPGSQSEALALLKDGSTVDVAERIAAIHDGAGRVTGLSFIVRDVSEQHRAAAELQQVLEEARESEARSRRFLADVAHQLGTPITGIRTCAETLLRGASPAARDRLLAGVVGEAARAGRLMASLLQMARLDRGEPVAPAPCDLIALCEEEAARARRLAPELAISVTTGAVSDDKPELDANAIAEILGNLLDNARRHARTCIDLAVSFDAHEAEVQVADDGPGLAQANHERAFERFESLDGKGGSGLGLPIARGLARAHGGDLTYEDGIFLLRLRAQMR